MKTGILILSVLGLLVGCVSGTKSTESYVGSDGSQVLIESDVERCQRSCNDSYERCMDSRAAGENVGVIGPSGVYGASAECRRDLKRCLSTCSH